MEYHSHGLHRLAPSLLFGIMLLIAGCKGCIQQEVWGREHRITYRPLPTWCSGSTTDSKPVSLSSILSVGALVDKIDIYKS